jgi:UDP:flavonoid glycosyltransferase YjiC (YdhE family)
MFEQLPVDVVHFPAVLWNAFKKMNLLTMRSMRCSMARRRRSIGFDLACDSHHAYASGWRHAQPQGDTLIKAIDDGAPTTIIGPTAEPQQGSAVGAFSVSQESHLTRFQYGKLIYLTIASLTDT